MKDGLKKLITKYGGTYTQYDNTTYDLLIQLCSALNLPYDKYMDENELFTLIAERGIIPGSGGESGGNGENMINPIGVSPTIPWRTTIYKVVNISMEVE